MSIFYPPYQEYVFLLMSAVGFFLGIVYDALKIKRKLLGTALIFLFFDDFLFMVLASVIFLFSVFAFNNGIFRWYEAAFCILGFAIYRLTLSKLVMAVFEFIINIIHRVLRMILKTVLMPLKHLLRLVELLFKPIKQKMIYISEIIFINKWINKLSPVGK